MKSKAVQSVQSPEFSRDPLQPVTDKVETNQSIRRKS